MLARVPEWFLTFTFAGLVAIPLGRMARRMLPTLSRELTAALHEDDRPEDFTAARPADTVAEATDDSQHEAGPAAEASGEAGPAAETPAPTVSAARTPVPAA